MKPPEQRREEAAELAAAAMVLNVCLLCITGSVGLFAAGCLWVGGTLYVGRRTPPPTGGVA